MNVNTQNGLNVLTSIINDPDVRPDLKRLVKKAHRLLLNGALDDQDKIAELQQTPLNQWGTIDWLDDDFD